MSWRSARIDTPSGNQNGSVSLIALTGRRLILAAIIAFAIFTIQCLVENADESYFTRWYGKHQIDALEHSLAANDSGALSLQRSDNIAHYWSTNANSYAFRIWNAAGDIIASSNLDFFEETSPLPALGRNAPDKWHRKIGPTWFATLTGRKSQVADQPVWIEVGTRGDPDRLRYSALIQDFIEDVVVPVVPTFIFAITLSMFSLRRALKPVQAVAQAARTLDPTTDAGRLQIPTAVLPREVSDLAKAVNDLLMRTDQLVQSQSEFIGRAAHQLQTPLAIMMLEAEKIADPTADRLKRDIAQLGETVDRLLELARMQGAPPILRGTLDLVALAEDVSLDLATFACEHGATITVVDRSAVPILGDYVSLREALRNLLINAIVHHPESATVEVRCGPGASISVEDDGPGIAGPHDAIFEPFARGSTKGEGAGLGLAIVRKVIELHNGGVSVRPSDMGGAAFVMELVPSLAPVRNVSPGTRRTPEPEVAAE